MAQTFDLTGDTVDLNGLARLDAPSLRGRVTVYDPTSPADAGTVRAMSRPTLERPLIEAGFVDSLTLELEVESVPLPAGEGLRGPSGEEVLQIEVPDLSEDHGHVVLSVDEAGVATWTFPVGQEGEIEPRIESEVRGYGRTKRFLVRSYVPTKPERGETTTRGLLGWIDRKIIRVLVYKITDPVFGRVGRYFAGNWEARKRPYGVRLFTPRNFNAPEASQMSGADWERMGRDRALLFIHGTISSAHGAFGGLSPDAMETLSHRYHGRVFAFDHFTLSHDPERNVRWFLEQIPRRVSLDLDIVCHSRGGLVARTLAERLARLDDLDFDPQRLRVNRVVFAAVPNGGTLLADPDHMVEFLDRFTTIVNLFPPNAAMEFLEGLLVAVKMVGHGALEGLAGLASMNPGGAFLKTLNAGERGSAEYYALTADYEPRGALRQLVRAAADATLDRVFEKAPNDLVVPTLGVFQKNGHGSFPLDDARVLQLDKSKEVIHTSFFPHPDTAAALLAWLS